MRTSKVHSGPAYLSSYMSASPSSSCADNESPKRSLTRVPLWIPISAFVGTSLALAIPFVMLRRQRAVLQMTLRENNAPPPRRTTLSASHNVRRTSTSTPAPSSQDNIFADSDGASPSMMTAFSHLNASTGILAAKAFAIATGIVAVSGVTLVLCAKEVLGVKDAREFGTRMHTLLSTSVPSLSSAIHRPPETVNDHTGSHDVTSSDVQDWRWEDAEKRLKLAYEQGGIALWAQTALRELEIEVRKERVQRSREVSNKDGSS